MKSYIGFVAQSTRISCRLAICSWACLPLYYSQTPGDVSELADEDDLGSCVARRARSDALYFTAARWGLAGLDLLEEVAIDPLETTVGLYSR